jgi:hypothetical protein
MLYKKYIALNKLKYATIKYATINYATINYATINSDNFVVIPSNIAQITISVLY